MVHSLSQFSLVLSVPSLVWDSPLPLVRVVHANNECVLPTSASITTLHNLIKVLQALLVHTSQFTSSLVKSCLPQKFNLRKINLWKLWLCKNFTLRNFPCEKYLLYGNTCASYWRPSVKCGGQNTRSTSATEECVWLCTSVPLYIVNILQSTLQDVELNKICFLQLGTLVVAPTIH